MKRDILVQLLRSRKGRGVHCMSFFYFAGKVFEIGSTGISSLKGHSELRTQCLNDFVFLYGHMSLVASNVKAVNACDKWFW